MTTNIDVTERQRRVLENPDLVAAAKEFGCTLSPADYGVELLLPPIAIGSLVLDDMTVRLGVGEWCPGTIKPSLACQTCSMQSTDVVCVGLYQKNVNPHRPHKTLHPHAGLERGSICTDFKAVLFRLGQYRAGIIDAIGAASTYTPGRAWRRPPGRFCRDCGATIKVDQDSVTCNYKRCNIEMCQQHARFCAECDEVFCRNHVLRCGHCGQTICTSHSTTCSYCLGTSCHKCKPEEGALSCQLCGYGYCKRCASKEDKRLLCYRCGKCSCPRCGYQERVAGSLCAVCRPAFSTPDDFLADSDLIADLEEAGLTASRHGLGLEFTFPLDDGERVVWRVDGSLHSSEAYIESQDGVTHNLRVGYDPYFIDTYVIGGHSRVVGRRLKELQDAITRTKKPQDKKTNRAFSGTIWTTSSRTTTGGRFR